MDISWAYHNDALSAVQILRDVTVWYVLCFFSQAAQGAVQHPHPISNTRVPALDPSLVTKHEKNSLQTFEEASDWL